MLAVSVAWSSFDVITVHCVSSFVDDIINVYVVFGPILHILIIYYQDAV